MIEALKNPKNPFSWLITGWLFAIVGYVVFVRFKAEPVGQILGGIGVAAIGITFLRLALTKIVYASLVLVFLAAYVGIYWKTANWKSNTVPLDNDVFDTRKGVTRWTPEYAAGAQGRVMEGAFAPAAMFEVIASRKIKGPELTDWLGEIKDASGTELGEGVRGGRR